MIRTKEIRKSFGTLEVLKGIDLLVERGEVVSIVGPSGAGKTTLLQILGTLSRPSSGEIEIDGEAIVIERHKAGDFVVCNLASLILPNIDTEDVEQLRQVIDITVRALDNVIDHNFYPIPYAKITNQRCRAIGLGTSGYHHWLVRHGIAFESEEHLQAVDRLYERINYHALQASCALAKEKGR